MKTTVCILIWLTAACAARAVEVSLDRVTSQTRRGEVELEPGGRAAFDLDPETATLTAAGTWTATYPLGPSRLFRYRHQFENLVVSAESGLSARSYECVEGTFGPIMLANLCGNYRFGDNRRDDGGAVDDVVVGPPKALDQLTVTLLDWNGSTLTVILSPKSPDRQEIHAELSLMLTFSAAAKTGAERRTSSGP